MPGSCGIHRHRQRCGGLPGYTRYPELFTGARWIWSVNLVFDNVVIARKTVR